MDLIKSRFLKQILSKFFKYDPNPFIPWALHHAYIGACVMFLGLMATGQAWSYDLGIFLMAVGSFILFDDVWEHTINKNTLLRIIFEKFIYPYFKKRN